MINKIVDENKYLKGIVKTNTFCLIDAKKLLSVVIKTTNNNYLCYYDVDILEFDYKDEIIYIHDVNDGYSKSIRNNEIEKITIL